MQVPVTDKNERELGYRYTPDKEVPLKPVFDLRTPTPLRYPSTTQDLVEFAEKFFAECIKTLKEKNARYAGAYDPFKNFRIGGDYGIAIRMTDKVCRLETLTHPTNTIGGGDESIEDTCHDTANYAMLLAALRSNERGTQK